jgi:hypothetical protein
MVEANVPNLKGVALWHGNQMVKFYFFLKLCVIKGALILFNMQYSCNLCWYLFAQITLQLI